MGATKVQFETEILELILETFPNQTFAAVEKNGKMGCQSPSTALANRKYWVAALAAAFFKLPNLVCVRSEGPQWLVISTGRRNTLFELLRWRLILQGLARAFVELPCDCAELCLRMDR